jgi:hypothetical protein
LEHQLIFEQWWDCNCNGQGNKAGSNIKTDNCPDKGSGKTDETHYRAFGNAAPEKSDIELLRHFSQKITIKNYDTDYQKNALTSNSK